MAAKQVATPPKMNLTPTDFSKSAVSRAVLVDALTSPSVTVPVTAGIVLAGATVLIGAPWFLGLVALVGAGAFCKKYLLDKDKNTSDYIAGLVAEMRRASEVDAGRVRVELQRLGCAQGVKQFDALPKRIQSAEKVLKDKFPQTGLTYMRYAGVIEQAKLTVLKQLRGVAARLQSVEHIESEACEPRSRTRATASDISDAECKLRQEQTKDVKSILNQNEEVLDELSRLAVELARIDTDSGNAPPTDAVIAQLVQLARQAHQYDN